MNKFGMLSILMVLINIGLFFVLRGPNANIYLAIILFSALSIAGVIFAFLSRKKGQMATGLVLNGCVIVFALLLLTAMRMGES